MRLLLDENASDRRFVAELVAAGHDVQTTVAALGGGASDAAILIFARADRRVVVTRDCSDFRALAASTPGHPGMLLVCAGGIASSSALVDAVGHVERIYPDMTDVVLSLVEFSW